MLKALNLLQSDKQKNLFVALERNFESQVRTSHGKEKLTSLNIKIQDKLTNNNTLLFEIKRKIRRIQLLEILIKRNKNNPSDENHRLGIPCFLVGTNNQRNKVIINYK